MSDHQVIARKYRPLTFDDVVGQDAIARTLKNAIASGRIAHAYMFCGPRGVGKTSTARILARALNCLERPGPAVDPCGNCDLCVRATQGEDLDVLEIDAASNRKVDDARNLIANVSFHPSRARFKVYVVDEVHMLTTEAFNALLKTLEEPPPHVKFIFATTDPQKVPATILSRCQRFDFRPVPPAEIAALLGRICTSEGLTAEEAALTAIARASVGGMRDAQSLLEQLATLGNGAVRLEDLHALLGTVPSERMRRLFETIRTSDVPAALAECAAILDAGTDPGELLRQAMHHARDLMLVRSAGPRAAQTGGDEAARQALADQAAGLTDATLVYAVSVLTEALKNVRLLGEGRLMTEAAFARLAGQGEMRFLDGLVRDLSRLERQLDGDGRLDVPVAHAGGPVGETVAPARPAAPPPDSRRSAAPGPGAQPGPQARASGPALAVAERPASRPASTAVAPRPVEAAPPRPEPEPRPVARPAPAAPPPPEPAPVDLRVRWTDVLEAARGVTLLRAALAPVRVMEHAGPRLVLSVPRGFSLLHAALRDPDSRRGIEDVIASVSGVRPRIEVVEREPDPEPEAEKGKGRTAAEMLQQRLTSAERDVIRRAAITKLIETELDGRIVHMERDG